MQDLPWLEPGEDRAPLNAFHYVVAAALMGVCLLVLLLGVRADKAVYLGGTISGATEKAEGRLLATSERELLFEAGGGSIAIPYSAITSVEYGQKAGRRAGVAVVSHPGALLPRRRSHLVTIAFKDRTDQEQTGVFELGEDVVRSTLQILEVRTGREIEMQDEAACLELKTPQQCVSARDRAR